MTRSNKPDRRLALSQSMLDNQSMESDLDMACESGAHAVALYAPLVRKTGARETVRLLKERNLEVTSIHLGLKLLEVSEEEADAILRDSLTLAAEVGAPVAPVSAGCAGDRTALEADDAYLRRLERVAPLAGELGVRMGLEPLHPFLHWLGYVHTVRHAARLTSRIDNFGIIFDTAHMYWDGDLEQEIQNHADQMCLVQVANIDGDAQRQRRWVRAPLDQGAVPIPNIIRLIDAAGYRGAYESEILLDLPHQECIDMARSSRLWFEQIWQHAD